MMKKLITSSLLLCSMMFFVAGSALAESVGNPRPGFPHDTITIHVQKGENGPKNCNGGHSLFLRTEGGVIPEDTILNITMIDWVQVDNDTDGSFDEDPPGDANGDGCPGVCGVDDDGDGLVDEDENGIEYAGDPFDDDEDGAVDEDGVEPGAVTTALDCDSWLDHEVSLQIRDTDPRQGYVSTQEWFIRLIGKPGEEFAFTTFANQTVECHVTFDPTPEAPNSGDEVIECTSGESGDWVELAYFNLADGVKCVKQVKLGGKNPEKGGGKTQFCDITEGFLVDVDEDGDGITDLEDQFIFSISCIDNPETTEIDETEYCPLSSLIWEIEGGEDGTTSKAKAQIFVGHTGTASVKSGKVKKPVKEE